MTDAERGAAEALLAAWADAQSRGDWRGYQALHHARFRAVRHAGATLVRLDRKAWLRERAAQFARPTRVSTADVVAYQAGDRVQLFAAVTRAQKYRTTTAVENLVFADGKLVFEEQLAPAPPPAEPPPGPAPREGFGYDRAPTLAAMRVAPIAGGQALIAESMRDLPAIDLAVVDSALDPITGRVLAARVDGALAAGDPLHALAGAPIVVLDRRLVERCRGTLGPVTVRAVGRLPRPTAPDAVATTAWSAGRHVIAARVDAPCTGAFVRGPDGAPIDFPIEHDQEIPIAILRAIGKAHGEAGAAVDVSAELAPSKVAGFALFALRPSACDTAFASRVLYSAQRAGRKWNVHQVATLPGTDPSMLLTDLDGDGALDAILAGAAYVGGRLDLRDPVLAPPWPAGLTCGRAR